MSPSRKPNQNIPKPPNKNLAVDPTVVPPSSKGGTTTTVRSITARSEFSGPLPPPEVLIRYNDVIPNGGDRIIIMAEKQQDHRILLEEFVLKGDSRRADLGLILGFILALLVAGGGIWVVLMGKDIAGLTMIFVPLATLVGTFIRTQRVRNADREARNKTKAEREAPKKS